MSFPVLNGRSLGFSDSNVTRTRMNNAPKFNFPHLKNGEDEIGFIFEIYDEGSNGGYALWLARLPYNERKRRGLTTKRNPVCDEVLS